MLVLSIQWVRKFRPKFGTNQANGRQDLVNLWSIFKFGPVTIPPGHVFILGDFRSNAEDSRFRGFVPLEDIHAKVIFP